MAPDTKSSVVTSRQRLGHLEHQRLAAAPSRLGDERSPLEVAPRASVEAERRSSTGTERHHEREHERELEHERERERELDAALAASLHQVRRDVEAQRGTQQALREGVVEAISSASRWRWVAQTALVMSLLTSIGLLCLLSAVWSAGTARAHARTSPTSGEVASSEEQARVRAELEQLRRQLDELRQARAATLATASAGSHGNTSPSSTQAAGMPLGAGRPPTTRPSLRPSDPPSGLGSCHKCLGIPMCTCGPSDR